METIKSTFNEKIIYIPGGTPPTDVCCLDAKSFTELIAAISARMVKVSAETLDQEIINSLAEVFMHLDADRGGLLKVVESPLVVRVSHAWYRGDSVTRVPEKLNVAEFFPWAFKKILIEGNIVALAKCSALPDEAAIDRDSLHAFENKSTLTIPLFIGEQVSHLFTIDVQRFECEWPIDIIKNIKLLGEIFVSALQRREHEQLLTQLRNRLETAAASAEAGLWELNRTTGELWATDQARVLFGYSEDEQITVENFLAKVCADDRKMVRKKIDQLQGHDTKIFAEYRILNSTGERWMCSRGQLVLSDNKEREILMGVSEDITRRKLLEKELQDRMQEIEQLHKQLEKENMYLRNEASLNNVRLGLVGDSDELKAVMVQATQVAVTDSTVLLQGETGTGKELLAQAIHRLSGRASRAMIKVNCGALPDALVESELFGREKGAYTGALSRQAGRFELADASTLFLDEISELPLETQAKLLRVLQEGEFQRLGNPRTIKVDVRIIASSNRNLAEEVAKGRFRRDLYYRLNIFPITIPPLRERPEDIPQLVWEFVNEFGTLMGKKIRKISTVDMEYLQRSPWPGNVRELRNVIEYSMILSHGKTLEVQRKDDTSQKSRKPTKLVDVERQHIKSILKLSHGRIKGKGGAADLLDMKPSTLYSRMQKLGISSARHSS